MSELVNLQRVQSDALVAKLKELLEQAESGSLVNIMYVGERFVAGGERRYITGNYGKMDDLPRTIGMLHMLAHDELRDYFKAHQQ